MERRRPCIVRKRHLSPTSVLPWCLCSLQWCPFYARWLLALLFNSWSWQLVDTWSVIFWFSWAWLSSCSFGATSIFWGQAVPPTWLASLTGSPGATYSDPLVSSPPRTKTYSQLPFSGHVDTSRHFLIPYKARGSFWGAKMNAPLSSPTSHTVTLHGPCSADIVVLWQLVLHSQCKRRPKPLPVWLSYQLVWMAFQDYVPVWVETGHGSGGRSWCSVAFLASSFHVLSWALPTRVTRLDSSGWPGLALTMLNETRATWSVLSSLPEACGFHDCDLAVDL